MSNPHSRIILFLLGFLVACAGQSAPSASNPYPGPQAQPYPGPEQLPLINGTPVSITQLDPPQPTPGKASLSGTIVSNTVNRLIPGTPFYLTLAVGPEHRDLPQIMIGPDTEKGDIRGSTDEKGQFVIRDIPPGNYYLIFWGVYDWIPAENSKDDHTPRLIELATNQKLPLGITYVPWP